MTTPQVPQVPQVPVAAVQQAAALAQQTAGQPPPQKKPASKRKPRNRRPGMHNEGVLFVNETMREAHKDFNLRWINASKEGRRDYVSTQDDYEPVLDPGSHAPVERIGSNGTRMLLMKKPLDWYKDDQKAKAAHIVDPMTMSEAQVNVEKGEYLPENYKAPLANDVLV